MKVLLVEDDSLTAKLLASMLGRYHYTVEQATDGQQGFELADQFDYDLILLDVRLPKLDGVHLCQQLRAKGCSTPILMLTGCDSKEDIIRGLDAGADDYVVKPYEPEHLTARIRSLLRRREKILLPRLLTWGNLTLNPDSTEVTYQGHVVHLTAKEYGLLELFLRHPQRVFSRSAILDLLWRTDDNLVEGTVTNLVKDLRRKLRAANITEEVVETLYGLGYRLKPSPPLAKQSKQEEKDNRENQLNPTHPTQADTEFNAIVQQFQDTLDERILGLDQALQALQRGHISPEQQQQAREEAHQLIGTLSFFGYGSATAVMQAIEATLQQTDLQQMDLQQTDWTAQSAHISQLRIALKQINASSKTQSSDLAEPIEVRSSESAVPQMPLVWEPRSSLTAGKVIAVDDDAIALETIVQTLQPWGFEVIGFTDSVQFWQQFSSLQPDLVLLDLQMPHLDGIELCQRIRQHPTQGDLPLLIVTGHTEKAFVQQIFAAGADDFVSKPIVGPELVTRVSSQLQQSVNHPGQAYPRTLAQDNPAIDRLTGLTSRTCFEEKLAQDWQEVLRSSIPCALLLADIDGFRTYNRCHGYLAGDDCLRAVAQVLQETVAQWNAKQQNYRSSSFSAPLASFAPLIARYRDDEFTIWLPDIDAPQVIQMAELLRQKLTQSAMSHSADVPWVTLSLGITVLEPVKPQLNQTIDDRSPFEAIDNLVSRAEQALQTAKQSGENTYCLLPI